MTTIKRERRTTRRQRNQDVDNEKNDRKANQAERSMTAMKATIEADLQALNAQSDATRKAAEA